MDILLYIAGVLAIAVGIGVSIALHELGHLVPAKKFGVKCTQYMIGFGPTLWSRRIGETEYGIKAIPLGGYVKMIGMLPPAPGDPDGTLRSGSTGAFDQMAESARAQDRELVGPGEEDRVFYKLGTFKKIVVMLGGPLMNFVIGTVILAGFITMHGVLDPSQPLGSKVQAVARCVPTGTPAPSTPGAGDTCAGRPDSPAYAAGLRPGDQIVTVSGTTVAAPSDITRLVRPHAGTPLPVVVQRGDQRLQLTITPASVDWPRLDAAGKPMLGPDGTPLTERGGFLGTTTRPLYAWSRRPLSDVPAYVGDAVARTAGVVLRIPEKMVGVWQAAFGGGERDPEGPVSVVGVGRTAGEKASGMVTGSFMDDIDAVPFILQLLAGLNLALFVFNLIPIPPLDGGHIAGAVWEGLRRAYARMRKQPDPGPVDVARLLPVAYAMSILLIGMSALLIYADLVRPVRF